MEDELEDRMFYSSYTSHMKFFSKFLVGLPLNGAHFGQIWRMFRFYLAKPEVVLIFLSIFVILMYIHAVEIWSRSLVDRLRLSFGNSIPSKSKKFSSSPFHSISTDLESSSWELKDENVAVYAIQGRRPKMEDRFVVNENINGTGVNLYAVFDGHGGEFAANYARDNLINNLHSKIIELKNHLKKEPNDKTASDTQQESVNENSPPSPKVQDNEPLKLEDKEGNESKDIKVGDVYNDEKEMEKNECLPDMTILGELKNQKPPPPSVQPDLSNYLNGENINFGRLITDEVLAADRLLVEAAKKNMDLAGTTALLAIVEGSKLIVANVGDSRGVMCDWEGKTVPLSYDHKPQQSREKKRIEEAGGSVCFNGVWRVAGILATSRAMGDYPLKDRNLVIADPDVLTFNLKTHKPKFIILASDGLWDTFSNEEAVAYISSRLNEPHFGAKSITLQAYYKGSLDNITVLVINLSNHTWT